MEIPFIDGLMGSYLLVSIVFTTFAIAGLANAINIIDGFNGLAAGNVAIMLSAFVVVASLADDPELAPFSLVVIAVLFGFSLVNFPLGYVFSGNGGAYFSGILLASLAVMLAARNPEISPWVVGLIVVYPVLETTFSAIRKSVRKGHRPSQPDKLHRRMLVYRSFSKKIAKALGSERLANSATGVLMWAGAMMSLIFVALIPHNWEGSLPALLPQAALYALVYRRVARLRLCRARPQTDLHEGSPHEEGIGLKRYGPPS